MSFKKTAVRIVGMSKYAYIRNGIAARGVLDEWVVIRSKIPIGQKTFPKSPGVVM
jgi:hypothetical protein